MISDQREGRNPAGFRPISPLEMRLLAWYLVRIVKLEIEREDDGRWLAEIPELPGVMAYGNTRQEAVDKAETLALRVLADRLEHGEKIPQLQALFAIPA